MDENPTTIQKFEVAMDTLDRLSDNPKGRARCGYIWILNEILEDIKKDILIMEEKIKMAEKGEESNAYRESD